MHRRLIIIIILLFIFTAADDPDHISINCGGGAAPATAPSGRQWGGDAAAPKGASTVKAAVDPVPYGTARISRSQFSYSFQLSPGQKFIRLHFNPVSYHGFQSFHDLFSVEAGPFTLLANFSASITARALSLNLLAKEFCIIVQQSQPLNIVFSPETRYNYAFINGIEIISVPSTISYCHGGDAGVHVLGQKSVIYVDNTTALERVYHQNVKWGGSVLDDFGKWASNLKQNANKVYNNRSWRVSVDVGFRYLIRIHLCEVGVDNMDFSLLIDNMIALSSADDIHLRNQSILWYNYMVMVEGHKREGKRTISVSLNSQQNFLEGFEVFKLSNHDRSLASPNPPLPPTPTPDSPSHTVQTLLHYSPIARRNAIATVVFAVICLLNIIVHLLLKMWGAETTEEENKPSARAKPLCRTFSLAEIQSATDNFHSGFIIGKGGFGNVYKGFMDNGREIVAIKRSKPGSKQGELQFWTEVETLSELRHVNLVSLIGYCIEQKEMILVYEYMPDGTLADHLYKLARKSKDFYPLSWKQRLKICIGAARALDYLHTGHGIIHRDVKASNILFDGNFVAKVSDFGLAKTGGFSESQSQDSTNLKGTFGYIDPNFFTTRKLTKESDMYSFGVVLLEVLCGRAAVEPWNIEEEKRSLTTWAIDNISKGQVDRIVAPSLSGEISPDSLKTFVKVAERCLLDEPKKRPAAAHVVIKLELALQRQEKADSLAPKELTSFEDVFSSTHKSQKENMNFSVPSEKVNGSDALHQKEKARSSAQDEIRNVTDNGHRTILSFSPRAMSSSFNVQDYTSLRREQSNSTMINSGRKDGKKSMMHRITRKLWPPLDLFRKTRKPSNKTDLVGMSVSAPLLRRTSNTTLGGNNITNKRKDGLSSTPTLRIFSIEELKAATRNFRSDTVLGEGGFGTVYKGWIHENSSAKEGSASIVAVKKLDHEGQQGFKEWQSEVQFLGRLSHPNLVKLLGYGWDNQDLFLVYEFMQKGSLENHLFRRSHQRLSWDIRLNILIGAARGLAFLHSSDIKIIYRDFKSSNILLDEWYHAKISDFGLAKTGPFADNTHVSTQVMGTHGYAAPEYIMTGHLTTKSDVYGFGVVLLEVVTGLRVIDKGRPAEECNLVVWTKAGRKLKKMIDPRMEGRYAPKSAAQVGELAFNCLQYNPKTRPTMQQVVHTLEQAILDAKPKQPRVVRFSPQPRPS